VGSTSAEEDGQGVEYFPSTRWSLIFAARRSSAEDGSTEALNQLCKTYWRPALSFLCRQGYPPAEAEDLVQEFFIAIGVGKLLQGATPVRGRFRSLLLKSLKNFSIDAKISGRRQKRGGEFSFISWENANVNVPVSCSADCVFDIEWAVTIAEEATRRLREECESKGQRWLFEELISYLDLERTQISYRALSAELRVPEKRVKHLLHEFRKRYRSLLREEVGKTLEDPADIEDEIRYLCEALASAEV
jgi:DNA-directed RNA polymerase specialized sigma24 family protein